MSGNLWVCSWSVLTCIAAIHGTVTFLRTQGGQSNQTLHQEPHLSGHWQLLPSEIYTFVEDIRLRTFNILLPGHLHWSGFRPVRAALLAPLKQHTFGILVGARPGSGTARATDHVGHAFPVDNLLTSVCKD